MADFDLIADLRVQTDATSVEKAVQNLQKYDNLLATAGAKAAESFRSSLSYVEKLRVREQELYKQRDAGANQTVESQRKINKELENTQAALQKVTNAQKASQTQQASGLTKLSQSLFGQITAANLLTSAIQKVGQAAKDLVIDIFNATKETEKLQSDLSFFLRGRGLSENAITATISEIKQFAADNPVADLKTTTEGFLALLNASTKIGVNQAIELNKSLVDITAGNIEQQKGLVNVLGQVARQNKIVGNDWFQFSNNGLNLIETLKGLDKFAGKTDQQIKELATKGKINFKDLSDAILDSTAEGGKYFGRSEAAAKTLNGQLAALKDAVFNTEAAFGEAVKGDLTEFVKGTVKVVNSLKEVAKSEGFKEFSKSAVASIKDVIETLGNLLSLFYDLDTQQITALGELLLTLFRGVTVVLRELPFLIKGFVIGVTETFNVLISGFQKLGDAIGFSAIKINELLAGGRKTSWAEFIAQTNARREAEEKAGKATEASVAALKRLAAISKSENLISGKAGRETEDSVLNAAKTAGATLEVIQKNNDKLTKEEIKHLKAIFGVREDAAVKEESAIDKEAAAKLKKQKEFHDNFLKKEIEFNENLQKIINDNNDKLAEIREKELTANISERVDFLDRQLEIGKISREDYAKQIAQLDEKSLATIKQSNERAKQAELRATADRGAEIIKAEKEVREELGKIPADLAVQFAAAKEKIKTIEGQINTKYAVLEKQELTKFQKQQNQIILKSFEERMKLRAEFNEKSIQMIKELNEDTKRKTIELSNDTAALLDYDNSKQIEKIKELFDKLQSETELGRDKGYITEKEYNDRILRLNELKSQQLLDNEKKLQAELDAERQKAFDIQVKKTTDYYNAALSGNRASADIIATEILGSKSRNKDFLISESDRKAKLKELQIELQEQNELEKITASQLEKAKDKKKVEQGLQAIYEKQAKLKREIAENEKEGADAAKKNASAYISGIESGLNSTFEVINAIETALTRSIDRQIELQKERVTAALELAKKGNAEALTIEEDRLNELEKKRRKFAQAQIAINTAQRVSAALLTIANVTAGQSATGPLAPITIPLAIASVLASLATGFAEAQALEKGTLAVKPKNGVGGRKTDDIPAWLNLDEIVMPADRAKDYMPTMEAVYYRGIPAEALNEFVTNYGKLPKHNFSLPQSRNISDNSNELVKEIKSLKNELQNMKSKVSISFDANGFTAAMQNTENILDSILGNL